MAIFIAITSRLVTFHVSVIFIPHLRDFFKRKIAMPPLRRHSLIMSYYSFIEHGLLPDFTVGVLISTSQSGATKQQLTGSALTEFVTKKTGVRREDVTVNGITASDLDAESFKIFRREALRSKRMTKAELNISNEELLSKLKLLSNGKLKRSPVLFYGDPSIVQVGSYVNVGKFANGTVEYHDDLEGSLISTEDKIVDLIYLNIKNDSHYSQHLYASEAGRCKGRDGEAGTEGDRCRRRDGKTGREGK